MTATPAPQAAGHPPATLPSRGQPARPGGLAGAGRISRCDRCGALFPWCSCPPGAGITGASVLACPAVSSAGRAGR
jgi:hypothetical protein